MSYDILIGVVSLAIGIGLVYIAMPKKTGELSSLFGRNETLLFLYPVIPLVFIVIGLAEIIQYL
jgi:hypothetical protein